MRNSLLVAAILALGCGDIVSADVDAGSGDGGSIDAAPEDPCDVASLPYEDLQGCMGRAFCELFGCIGTSLPGFCLAEPIEHPLFDEINQYIEAGTVIYDPEAAARCIGALLGGCETSQFEIESVDCDAMMTGTLADGQPCYSSDECGSSGYCDDGGGCFDQCCMGTCTRSNLPLYADCESDCNAGLYCVENPATLMATCQAGLEGSPCTRHRECMHDHYCTENDTGVLGECAPDVGENAACEGDHWCETPLFCVGDDLPLGQGTCRRVDSQGDMCDTDDNEADIFGGCVGSLFCDQPVATSAGTCEPLPGEGESCAASLRCGSADLYCRNSDDVCVLRPGSGENCTNAVCQNGVICLPDDTCGDPLATGQPCESDLQCATFICEGNPEVCQEIDLCYE